MSDAVTILTGDCVASMRTLSDASVHCCVTSPPYFGLRDYRVDGQIGLETTPDAYVAKLVDVFREVRRVLRDDGTLWLNLGDSYAAQRGGTAMPAETLAGGISGRGDKDAKRGRESAYLPHRNAASLGLKHKDLIGIPWRVAFALQADGWWLRQDIIWQKPNPMPESVRDRCTKAHEYLFLLSKRERYYFDAEAISEASCTNDPRRPYTSLGAWEMDGRPVDQRHGGEPRSFKGSKFHTGKTGEHQQGRASAKPRTAGNKSHKYVTEYESAEGEEHRTKAGLLKVADVPWEKRNRRSVWTVSTKPYKGAHFATFPPDLIEPCILAGSPLGGTVLDPFAGSGTTGQVAMQHHRKSILCELNPAYVALIRQRLAEPMLPLNFDAQRIQTFADRGGKDEAA